METLREYFNESSKIVFFCGAGVSTESGIPDFRSKDGLYNKDLSFYGKHEPEYFLSKECLNHDPKTFFRFFRDFMDVHDIKPNPAHYFMAEMEAAGKSLGVVTQNIDGLHQKAGSKNVFEIHGTTQRCYCVKCGKEYSSDFIFNSSEPIPCCECGGMVRPDVTLYGERLPVKATADAVNAISQADMLVIAGTSLTVYPAANFIYDFSGNHLVVINRDKIKNLCVNPDSDLVIEGMAGEILGSLRH